MDFLRRVSARDRRSVAFVVRTLVDEALERDGATRSGRPERLSVTNAFATGEVARWLVAR